MNTDKENKSKNKYDFKIEEKIDISSDEEDNVNKFSKDIKSKGINRNLNPENLESFDEKNL